MEQAGHSALSNLEGALQNGIAEPMPLWHVCGTAEYLATMAAEFHHHSLLSHSAKDMAVVRPMAERLGKAGLRLWFDEWVLKPGDSIPAKIH